MKTNIKLDKAGFPQAPEFFIPILKILKEENCSEDDISNKLIEYFNLNEEQLNQKVKPKNEDGKKPNTKLKSHTHFAIVDFERFECIKKDENKIYSIEYKGEQILNMGIKKLNKTNLEKLVTRLDLIRILGVLSNLKLDVSFLRLTKNHFEGRFVDGLSNHFKSFVKRNNINDYENQEGGGNNKKCKTTYSFTNDEKIEFTLSLYRTTRRGEIGEARINFIGENGSKLWSSFKPGMLLFTIINEELYLLNLSDDSTLNSLLSQKGEPYETLKKESNKKYNENVKLFFEHLKKLNDKKYFILNSEHPNINSILKKEGFVCENSQKYEYNNIEFEVLNGKDVIFDKKSDNIVFKFIIDGTEEYVEEYNREYFVKNPRLELSSVNPEGNSVLKNDYESGLLKVVDEDVGNILTLNFEYIFKSNEKFNLVYKNIITNYGDEYVLFEKILSYSNPNFNLLSFLMLDDIFEKLDINIKLILDTEFWDDLLSCNLKLESNCDEILKKLFYPNIIYLKDNFESF
ncbi:MAG: hypothetical protein IKV87_03220 [Methanobrevibacter sp.]|nr:hypothetical protein [Methanobrevibacter sp.]